MRLKQFAVSFLVVLSLFVSSISACTCADILPTASSEHCQPPVKSSSEKRESHHWHDAELEEHDHAKSAETKADSLSFSQAECCCIKPAAPKVFAKNETVKSEKQGARISPNARVDVDLIAAQIIAVKPGEFIRPFYLSDSFYNLTPGRAPPHS